jgi:Mlc titration factor MtfA (ptsG expression regulator)
MRDADEFLLDEPDPLLRANMALYGLFDAAQRQVICGFARQFYRGKRVYAHAEVGCSEALLAAVAGQAALVGAAQRTRYFASVRWIYFCGDELDVDGDARGASTVRLHAQTSLYESQVIVPGCNLVVHEFAHILDEQLGISGSTRALRQAYGRYRDRLEGGGDVGEDDLLPNFFTPLDSDYGGIEPGEPMDFYPQEEFFSYLSEAFFTRPLAVAAQDAALYADLAAIYGLDMAAIFRRGGLA